MSKRKERLLALVTATIAIIVCLMVAEVVLRFMPVSTGLFVAPVTSDRPVFHFRPAQEFLFSRDWDMKLANRGRINNAGFVNDQDYRREIAPPLIAVVGDSYIEALMVPYPQTVQGRLAAGLAGEFRVYSFGVSGAALSQYLTWAHHAVEEYGATAVVINVVGNDFDESLADYGSPRGFYAYVRDADGDLRRQLFEWHSTGGGRITSRSALASYLVYNLQAVERVREARSWISGQSIPSHYVGNTSADASPQRVRNSLDVIDAFFRDLPEATGLPPNRVLFTMDGFRYPKAAADGAGTYFDQMRRAFRAKGEALGYEVIDLDPAFFARNAKTGARFEYPADGHWNPTGHEVAYQAVMGSRMLQSMAHTRFGMLNWTR